MSKVGEEQIVVTDALDTLDQMATALALADSSGLSVLLDWKHPLQELQAWAQAAAQDDLDQCIESAIAVLHGLSEDVVDPDASLERLGQVVCQMQDLLRDMQQLGSDAVAGRAPAAAPIEEDREIVGEFVMESQEQLADADVHLLTIEKQPDDQQALDAVFRCLHTIKGLAGFLNLGELEGLAHVAEDLLDQARRGERELKGRALDLIFDTVDALGMLIGEVSESLATGQARPAHHETVAQLVNGIRGLALGDDLSQEGHQAPAQKAPVATAGDSAGDSDIESADHADAAVSESVSDPEPVRAMAHANEAVRVDAERLDRLVDMIGELVITESMVKREAEQSSALAEGATNLFRHMSRMDKITRELQELAGSLRMVPVRASFRKMSRLARDVAKKTGKQIDFHVSGEDTQLDKTVVDRVGEPLVHLVRNAIDHGLEATAEPRIKLGKPAVGRVDLRAYHKGGNIHIEVADDGRGLDRQVVLAKALDRGLVHEGENLADRDVFKLICEPGFSTVDQVTAISGRGVGMDVVKRSIDAMGGTLEIMSQLGKGTCFSMRLPLTLAVIDGLVVRLGGERYVIPTLSVVRLVTPLPTELSTVLGKGEMLMVQGQLVPVLRLDRLFGVTRDTETRSLAVIAEADNSRVAILIDELVGQQQAVIKSLGDGLGDTPGVSGCAIMPDGRVGLVLDVGGLLRLANTNVARDGRRSMPVGNTSASETA